MARIQGGNSPGSPREGKRIAGRHAPAVVASSDPLEVNVKPKTALITAAIALAVVLGLEAYRNKSGGAKRAQA